MKAWNKVMIDTPHGEVPGIAPIIISASRATDIPATMKKAVMDAGATVKIIAPKVGGVKLADGSILVADKQLAGTPSVLFDAVGVGGQLSAHKVRVQPAFVTWKP